MTSWTTLTSKRMHLKIKTLPPIKSHSFRLKHQIRMPSKRKRNKIKILMRQHHHKIKIKKAKHLSLLPHLPISRQFLNSQRNKKNKWRTIVNYVFRNSICLRLDSTAELVVAVVVLIAPLKLTIEGPLLWELDSHTEFVNSAKSKMKIPK